MAPHLNKTNTRPVIKDVTKALTIVSSLISAGTSPCIMAQSLVCRAQGYELRFSCPHIHSAKNSCAPLRRKTALRLCCCSFVLSLIISAIEIMKSFKARSDSYCMTEQVGIWSLAQGHFDSVDGRMLAVEGIEPVSRFEFLLQTFFGDGAALEAEIISLIKLNLSGQSQRTAVFQSVLK